MDVKREIAKDRRIARASAGSEDRWCRFASPLRLWGHLRCLDCRVSYHRTVSFACSEFAGCALSFKGAMLVNPYDPDKVAESIHIALAVPVRDTKSA